MGKRMEYEDPDVPIPHPTAEMYWHCDKKGVQLGALVAMATAPLVIAWRGGRGMSLLMRTGRATAIGAFLVGPLFSCSMCYAKLRNEEIIAVYDRAYRLRFHQGQVRTDQFSLAGTGLGAVAGALLMKPPLTGGLYGAAFGAGLGVLAHFFTSGSSSSSSSGGGSGGEKEKPEKPETATTTTPTAA